MDTRHAVILDDKLIMVKPDKSGVCAHRLAAPVDSLATIWRLGQDLKVTHFWVWEDSQLEQLGNALFDVSEEEYNLACIRQDPKDNTSPVTFAGFWQKGEYGHKVHVGYAHRGQWLWTCNHPVDVLSTVTYLENALQVPVQWSAGHMAFQLLKSLYPKPSQRERLAEAEFDLRDLPFARAAKDMIWKRNLSRASIGKTLHHYDKNSAYLSALRGVNVGVGTPIHITENVFPNRTGIYRVEIHEWPAPFDGVTLPRIIEGPEEWVTYDLLKYAISEGYKPVIHEAWVFEQSHRILDPWASVLWQARTDLNPKLVTLPNRQAQENAYDTIKETACIGTGKFAQKKSEAEKRGEYKRRFIRPNWWADAVGKARENICRNLKKLHEIGYRPVLIFNDGMFLESIDSDITTAIPGMLGRKGKLGGYKDEYSLTITPEIVTKFSTLSEGALLTYLNDLAEEPEDE